MRVLVIDDEPDVLLLCRVNLSFEGHEVIEASDGPQGLDAALRQKPDIIVLDVMLPHGDGFSLLEELKNRRETTGIPVIMLTAKARGEDQLRGWERGAALYLTKPFSPAALCEAVANVAAMSPAEREKHREQAVRQLAVLHKH